MTWTSIGRMAVVSAVAVTFATTLTAAQGRRGAGMGMPGYDRDTETTLSGTVEEVQAHEGRMGMNGTHLVFRTDSGEVEVHLGPSTWLADKKYEFAKGDQLQIVGSKVTIGGQDAFLAREIRNGGVTMTLRNENGIPEWSGRGPVK